MGIMTKETYRFIGMQGNAIPMEKRRLLMEYLRNDLMDRDIIVAKGKCLRKGTLLGELKRLSKPRKEKKDGKK